MLRTEETADSGEGVQVSKSWRLTMIQDLSVEAHVLIAMCSSGYLRSTVWARGGPQTLGDHRVPHHAKKGFCQTAGVLRLDQNPVDPVGDQVHVPAHSRGDAGKTHRHSFQHSVGHTFNERREDQQVGRCPSAPPQAGQ
jgi:hypothetical protein